MDHRRDIVLAAEAFPYPFNFDDGSWKQISPSVTDSLTTNKREPNGLVPALSQLIRLLLGQNWPVGQHRDLRTKRRRGGACIAALSSHAGILLAGSRAPNDLSFLFGVPPAYGDTAHLLERCQSRIKLQQIMLHGQRHRFSFLIGDRAKAQRLIIND